MLLQFYPQPRVQTQRNRLRECGAEADALSTRELCKQRRVFSTWESQHKKRVVPYGALLCHVVLRMQPANLRFWCRQLQLTFRSMKSTVIRGPSPNSLISKHHFFRCYGYGWWTNVCTTLFKTQSINRDFFVISVSTVFVILHIS